jgi:hypothetical protein
MAPWLCWQTSTPPAWTPPASSTPEASWWARPAATRVHRGTSRVSFDGSHFVVLWEQTDGNENDIHGARVSAAGVVLEPGGTPLNVAPGSQSPAQLAYGRATIWSCSATGGHRSITWHTLLPNWSAAGTHQVELRVSCATDPSCAWLAGIGAGLWKPLVWSEARLACFERHG